MDQNNGADRLNEIAMQNQLQSTPKTQSNCAVEATVAVIGGKWKPILLFHLLSGQKRYSELQKLLALASDRMLTRSLRELEQDRIISRTIIAEVPVRVEYALTKDGHSLIPVLNAMSAWGNNRQ